MKKNKITAETIRTIATSEITQKLAAITASVIENKIKSGISLKQAKKEAFEELELIFKVIKKLAIDKYNMRILGRSDNIKEKLPVELYVVLIAMGATVLLTITIMKMYSGF